MIRLTVLGSGTNVHPTRAAAGYLVQTDQTFLLDFGPRTLSNLIKSGVDRHRVTHILFSHFHADHFADFIPFFFDAVIFCKYQGGTRPPLTLIGPHGTATLMKAMMTTFPSFDRAPFKVTIREVSDRSFRIGETRITPATVTHAPKLHCVGYRIEYQNRVVAYSGDSQYCESLVRLCHEADYAVLDCSFPENRPGAGHLHAGLCGRVAQEAGVHELILSHFYPIAEQYDVRAQAKQYFPGRVRRARDLLKLRA